MDDNNCISGELENFFNDGSLPLERCIPERNIEP
jgi:hypothetical protein